ncbi:MAG: DUF1854 domain-containing protein [Firmicutes bacterium]|nr:DUF1854 domain-containing protein [Bacillota bacterium]
MSESGAGRPDHITGESPEGGSLAEYDQIRFIGPDEAVFTRTGGGVLSMRLSGKEYPRVNLCRLFPFSLGDRYVAVLDGEGKEIGIIKDLGVFSPAEGELFSEELNWRYFTPKILEIRSLKEEFGYTHWEVETDRGPRRFTVQGTSDNVIPVTETRILIVDMDGNRFEIADMRELDPRSLRLIAPLI